MPLDQHTHLVTLGLGANLGERAQQIARAIALLEASGAVGLVRASRLYATEPVGPEQPTYLNQVVKVSTALGPLALLQRTQEIERQLGRDRQSEERWGPRSIDIDLLDYPGVELDLPELKLPHPRLAERTFVLVPWAEIASDDRPAGSQHTIAELLEQGGARGWVEPYLAEDTPEEVTS